MKAHKYGYELTKNAEVVILSEDDQGWKGLEEVENFNDMMIKLYWKSNVPGSFAPESLIIAAIASVESMGKNVLKAESYIEEGLKALENDDKQNLARLTGIIFRELEKAEKDESHEYHKYKLYDDFYDYEKAIDCFEKKEVLLDDNFKERTKMAWLARLVGGALGTAIEGYTSKTLREKFGDITNYIREPNTFNDDITYEIAFLKAILSSKGIPSSDEIADLWLASIPSGWSAEQIALDNLKRGIYPPNSGSFRNPYKEWIGAQMRGAICGQVAPGNTYLAAKLAFNDARISHAGNGILGEIFNAVLVSLSFVEKDIKEILRKTINHIPKDSEYYQVVSSSYELCQKYNFSKAWEISEEKYKKYNWIHAYPNAAAEVIALYFGDGDFDKTMTLIAACGQDVDCNAAQIAVALAAMNAKIDKRWTKVFTNEINTYLRGLKIIKLNELVDETIEAANLLQ